MPLRGVRPATQAGGDFESTTQDAQCVAIVLVGVTRPTVPCWRPGRRRHRIGSRPWGCRYALAPGTPGWRNAPAHWRTPRYPSPPGYLCTTKTQRLLKNSGAFGRGRCAPHRPDPVGVGLRRGVEIVEISLVTWPAYDSAGVVSINARTAASDESRRVMREMTAELVRTRAYLARRR